MKKEILGLTCDEVMNKGCCCYCPFKKAAELCSYAQRTDKTFFEVIETVKTMNQQVEGLDLEEDEEN